MKNWLLEKLETIKNTGHYAVKLYYGADIGEIDIDIPKEKQKIQMTAYPIGFLGEIKIYWTGTVAAFKKFDINSKPPKISNPPNRKQLSQPGFYAWGSARSIDIFMDKFKKGK